MQAKVSMCYSTFMQLLTALGWGDAKRKGSRVSAFSPELQSWIWVRLSTGCCKICKLKATQRNQEHQQLQGPLPGPQAGHQPHRSVLGTNLIVQSICVSFATVPGPVLLHLCAFNAGHSSRGTRRIGLILPDK